MINRGHFNGHFLYELTEQDLLLSDYCWQGYKAGNVLIYTDRHDVRLGSQIARADDLESAREYLADGRMDRQAAGAGGGGRADSPGGQTDSRDSQIDSLSNMLCQRDELLRDMADSLEVQKDHNQMLSAQLDMAKQRLTADSISRDELLGDLQNASAEQLSVEQALALSVHEKNELEGELAKMIADLVELRLQKDDLERQLTASALPASPQPATEALEPAKAQGGDTEILTMASGKQVYVYHQFPEAKRRNLAGSLSLAANAIARIAVLLLLALVLVLATSVAATAHLNGISPGESLNLILSSLGMG